MAAINATLKGTIHIGKGSAKHNDRDFNVSKSDHIDKNRTQNNLYWVFNGKPEAEAVHRDDLPKDFNLDQYELNLYQDHYGDALEYANGKAIEGRHKDRIRTMDQWLHKSFAPTEIMFQIGNCKTTSLVKHEDLATAFNITNAIICKKYPAIVPIDAVMHLDEATPEIHGRYVVEGHDKNGFLKPLKDAGLAEMGIPLPDPSKPKSQYNNRMMTLTKELRETFLDEIEKLGYKLDRTPREDNQHLSTLQYKKREILKDIDEATKELSAVQIQQATTELALKDLTEKHEKKQEAYKEAETEAEKQYIERVDGLKKDYKKKKKDLEEKYEAQEKEVEEKEQVLKEREQAIEGKELSLDELEKLQHKLIWWPKDKANVTKTAYIGAENELRAERAEGALKALKKDNTALEELVNNKQREIIDKDNNIDDLMTRIERLGQKIEQLKVDMALKDEVINTHGLTNVLKTLQQLQTKDIGIHR